MDNIKNSIIFFPLPGGGFVLADTEEFINELRSQSKAKNNKLRQAMLAYFDDNDKEYINQIFDKANK